MSGTVESEFGSTPRKAPQLRRGLTLVTHDEDLAAGDPVSLPNLTPSVRTDVKDPLSQFGPTVVAASRLATCSVAAFKTLPENSWEEQDPRRRLGVVNFTPDDLETDKESKLQRAVVFIPEFNKWQFPSDYIPPSPQSILQRSSTPSRGHIRIEIPKPTPSPDSANKSDLTDTPHYAKSAHQDMFEDRDSDDDLVGAPSASVRKTFALPDELRSDAISVKNAPQSAKFEDAEKLAALSMVGMRSENAHLFPLLKDRFADPRTRWITVGYSWQAFEFVCVTALCVANMVVASNSGVATWLSVPPPQDSNQDVYDARFWALVSYKSLIVYQGIGIWSQVFQLAFFIDSIINNNAVELTVMYLFVLGSLVSSSLRFVRDQAAWMDIERDPYNPDPGASAYYQRINWALNLAKLVFACVSVVVWTPVSIKLYRLVGWRIYEWTGADLIVRNRVRAHQIYVILLRLFLYIAVSYCVLWVVFVLDALYLAGNELYGPSLSLFILLSLFVAFCGWLAARFQSLAVLTLYIAGIVFSLIIVPVSLVRMQSLVPNGATWDEAYDGVGVTAGLLWLISFFTLCSCVINAYYFWNGPILSWSVLERVVDNRPTEQWWQLPPPVKRFVGRWTGWRWISGHVQDEATLDMQEVPRMSIDAPRMSIDAPRMSIDAEAESSKHDCTRVSVEEASPRVSVESARMSVERGPSRSSRRPISVLSVKVSQRREMDRWAIDE